MAMPMMGRGTATTTTATAITHMVRQMSRHKIRHMTKATTTRHTTTKHTTTKHTTTVPLPAVRAIITIMATWTRTPGRAWPTA